MSLAQSITADLQEAGAHDPDLEHEGECLPGAWCGSTSLGRSLSQVRKVGVAVGSVCGPPTDPKVRIDARGGMFCARCDTAASTLSPTPALDFTSPHFASPHLTIPQVRILVLPIEPVTAAMPEFVRCWIQATSKNATDLAMADGRTGGGPAMGEWWGGEFGRPNRRIELEKSSE